jgi:GNAT superfamily N-acetyltransferase
VGTLRIELAAAGDLAALEAYLLTRADTCMILRSNLRAVGLAWAGERYQAEYVLGWRGGAVVGVAAHAWNGMVVVQADEAPGALARAVVAHSGRGVSGLMGPQEQVVVVRSALDLDHRAAGLEAEEILMALSLADLIMPPPLAAGTVRGRRAVAGDRELLIPWRADYLRETMGFAPGPETEARAAVGVDASIAERRIWVLERDADAVATTGFNAQLPDAVQIGGVYTPPPLRGRGYARAAVAASLLDARAEGGTRALLFTPRPDAMAAYQAIGFAPIGRYGLVHFG